MAETFLLLFSAGIMLAAAVPDPKEVTLNWLRLAGILSLALLALSGYFYLRAESPRSLQSLGLYGLVGGCILAQLAFAQTDFRRAQRLFAVLAFFLGTILPALTMSYWISAMASHMGIAAVTGLALMDMLLGHAYLTASRMTMRPFVRLNTALAVAVTYRVLCIGAAMLMLRQRPIEFFVDRYGLFLLTRILVGLVVPGVFIYMAHDCIKRRATQSATGILYVAGLLLLIGEIIALYLFRDTKLPL